MTEDQIKAIAEEFARLKNFNPGFHKEENEMAKLFEQFINFVQMHYCIVEREKVMEEYKRTEMIYNQGYPIECRAIQHTLNHLFGTSMFNQNKE